MTVKAPFPEGDRYLLYIDILGFAEMTTREPRKIARLYAILDSLNAHRHQSFKTIVFSDTVLVYNPSLANTDEERHYIVWYLIEFAEDLHHRLTGQDIYFRAVITTGNFSHYNLKNIECFFGQALVDAYVREKQIPSIGLFIRNDCNQHNRYFRVAAFDADYQFVYLNRSLESLNEMAAGVFPLTEPGSHDAAPHTPWQVRFLADVHSNMRTHRDPKVRTKFLTAWDFYSKRYPEMTRALVSGSFSLSALGVPHAWLTENQDMLASIKRFKRIGSGSPVSRALSRAAQRRS